MNVCKLLVVMVSLGILIAPVATDAQPPAKVRVIGTLGAGPSSAVAHAWEAFRQGLRELGYIEGQNIVIEHRSAEGKFEHLPDLAAELVRLKVDVIVAAPQAIPAARNATKTIPIVMGFSGDPVGSGFVASLARPGGNITGLSGITPELVGKHLELLKETVPKASRMAVLWNPANPLGALQLREAEVAARALGVRLQILQARDPKEIDSAFSAISTERAEALVVQADTMLFVHRTRIAGLAAKSRLPAIYGYREHAEVGGLMAYGPSIPDMFRRAATYVDKILKGAEPADLPVEQPTRFELVINLRTAKALGLTIPQSVLIRVDTVIR